jgi:hypothetical protein
MVYSSLRHGCRTGHFEVKVGAGVGVGARHLLVQFDAEARLVGGSHSRPPRDRLLEDLRVKPLHSRSISRMRKFGSDGRSGCWPPPRRGRIEMRRDLRIVGFRHAGDLLGLQEAAHTAQRHLQDRGGASLQHPAELIFGGQPFARGNRDGACRARRGPFLRAFPAARLLEPQRVIGLDLLREADGARSVNCPCVPNRRSALCPPPRGSACRTSRRAPSIRARAGADRRRNRGRRDRT